MAVVLFSAEQLAKAVASVEPLIPKEHTRGALVGTVDDSGAQVVVMLRPGENGHWSANLVGRHEWSGDNQAGASLVYSW